MKELAYFVLLSVVGFYLRSYVIGAATCCVQKSIILKVVKCMLFGKLCIQRNNYIYRTKLIKSYHRTPRCWGRALSPKSEILMLPFLSTRTFSGCNSRIKKKIAVTEESKPYLSSTLTSSIWNAREATDKQLWHQQVDV